MLFFFFLRRFFNYFIMLLLLFTLILGVSNVLLKLSVIPSFFAFCWALYGVIPLMGVYVFPLVTGLSVQMVVGSLMVDDELLIVRFFKSARRVLQESVLVFALTLTLVYVPLTFFWAPESYWVGKKMLLSLAKRQLYQLEPEKFHTPFPGVTFYFQKKELYGAWPSFSTIFLSFNGDKDERYFFTARKGYVQGNSLLLKQGSVHTMQGVRHYHASFQESELNVARLFGLEKDHLFRHIKFMSLDTLFLQRSLDKNAWFELHKRIAQVVWQFLLPFLAFWGLFVFGRRKSNFLASIIFNGLLFLCCYTTITVAQVFVQNRGLTLFFLYIPVVLLLMSFWWIFRKKGL